MRFPTVILLASSLLSAIDAKGNTQDQQTLSGSEDRQCAEVFKLEGIIGWMNDPDQLAEFQSAHNLTQAEVDAIRAKTAAESERLSALQSNATLMQECSALEATRQLRATCREMRRLTEIVNLGVNQTLLEDFSSKHDLPSDWITKLTDKANNASARLDELKSNATLVEACDIDDPTRPASKQGLIAEAKASSTATCGLLLIIALMTAILSSL